MTARTRIAALAVAAFALMTAQAQAAFPGHNGPIVFNTPDPPNVVVMSPDESGRHTLTHGSQAAMSADGRRMVFTDRNAIFVMNLDGWGLPRRLTTGRDPRFSPDGSKIVFVATPGDQAQIYVMNADGTSRQSLATPAVDIGEPVFSPDGLRIAYRRGGDIYTMDADGSDDTQLTDDAKQDAAPDYSPDGKTIAFTRGDPTEISHTIYTMPADGRTETALSEGMWAHFSPDGTKIVVGDFCCSYTVMNVDGTDRVVRSFGVQGGVLSDWAPQPAPAPPSARDIAFECGDALCVTEPDGAGFETLKREDGVVYADPAWSPDGRRLAVTRDDAIYVMDADGTGLSKVTEPGSNPTWSPDATRLAFQRPGPAGDGDVWVVGSDGSGEHPLVSAAGVEELEPDWSPDGARIVFHADGGLWTVAPDGSSPTWVPNTDSGDRHPAWSNDGTKIAYDTDFGELSTINADASGERSAGFGELATINADGSGERSAGFGYEPSWSPAGERLASGNPTIGIVSADGSDQIPLGPGSDPDWRASGPPRCANASLRVRNDRTLTIPLGCSDENGDPLTLVIDSGPAHGTLGPVDQSARTVLYTPQRGYSGADSVTFHATGGGDTSNAATVGITVLAPARPRCTSATVRVRHDRPQTVLLRCSDDDGDPLTLAIGSGPAHGTLAPINQSARTVLYTPRAGYSGADGFTFHATGGGERSDVATVSVTVDPSAPPRCTSTAADPQPAVARRIHLICADEDGDALTLVIDASPRHGTLGPIDQAAQTVLYTPQPTYAGADSFVYHATAGDGTSNSATVSLFVQPRTYGGIALGGGGTSPGPGSGGTGSVPCTPASCAPPVTCPPYAPGPCAGDITNSPGPISTPPAPGSGSRAAELIRVRRRAVLFRKARFSIAPGARANVRLRLTRRGRALLKHRRRVVTRVRVTYRIGTGPARTETHRLRLRRRRAN